MTTTIAPRRPRVKRSERLVLVHCPSMGSFHLYKINKDGSVSNSPGERIAVADSPQEACRKMDVTFTGFEAVNGMLNQKFRTADDQVRAIWRAAQQ